MTPWIVLATIVGYFVLLFIISWAASRRADANTALTGGRQAPWFIVAIAMIGAPISGVTFVSVPGQVAVKSFSYMQMVLGFAVGYFVIAYVLMPLFFKRNLVSIYGYLEQRFGGGTHKTGAWFFFISKMLGAAVRFYVVCVTLQLLVFAPLGIPFVLNVIVTIALIFLYTLQGGVKTVIWTDTLKSFCLIMSVVLCIFFIARGLGYNLGELCSAVAGDDSSRIFFFDNPKEGTYFWKQFIAGIFMVIATTGLDQDLMQRTLASKNVAESKKSLIVSGITQIFVVGLFLVLGTLLVLYSNKSGLAMPEKTDELFGQVAFSGGNIPIVVGVLFILGLVSAAYSAAGSALTALTTSFTVDILESDKRQQPDALARTRKWVHVAMAAVMGLVIIVFYAISNSDAISAVYTLASYTYGPILGLFAFGMMCRAAVRDRWVPLVCVAAPVLSFFIQQWLASSFGYTLGFELLLLNALLTMIGLALLIKKD
ncbi:MAG: sodium:solute symporter [Muribaculaceae bacterium]|nr:sodium:solute symporter [Muribaculaceae bacterium]HAP50491.1 sodium:solute symporter [Porphyromonadaceae bacterium]